MYELLHLLPKNYLSACIGALARIPIPPVLRGWGVRLFARLVGADLNEAALPAESYRSIAEFFVRDLAPGLRPLGQGICSPVDGAIRDLHRIDGSELEQVKGRSYSIESLLASAGDAKAVLGGYFINLYLSPPDYHHVHAPCDLSVDSIRYIPGYLWPVNTWALNRIPELFSRNERVVISARSERGRLWMVMVGATNVGRMSLAFDPLITNSANRQGFERRYDSPIVIPKGQRLGTFHLGSTVLLLLDSGAAAGLVPQRGAGTVRLGQSVLG